MLNNLTPIKFNLDSQTYLIKLKLIQMHTLIIKSNKLVIHFWKGTLLHPQKYLFESAVRILIIVETLM